MLRTHRIPYRLRKTRQWQRNITDHATPASSSAASRRTPDHDEDSELDFDLDYDFNTNLTPTEDGTRTLRRRESGRSLPISPILDPTLIAAKNRHKNKKTDPSTNVEDLTPLQLALRRNPYAQALATPVRQEAITGAFLPRHFLQAFGTLFKHPRASPSDPEPASDFQSKALPHIIPVPSASSGTRTYALNTHTSISRLSMRHSWHKLIKPEMMDKLGIRDKRAWEWDMDMAEVVLQKLKHLVRFKLRGVLLHTGTPGEENGLMVLDPWRAIEETETQKRDKISNFGLATIVLFDPVSEEEMAWLREQSAEYQVYDLCALLGKKAAARIKRGTKFEDCQMMGLNIPVGPETLQRKNVRMVVAGLDRLTIYMKDMQRAPPKKDSNQLRREGRPEGLHEGVDLGDHESDVDFDSLFEEGEDQFRHGS